MNSANGIRCSSGKQKHCRSASPAAAVPLSGVTASARPFGVMATVTSEAPTSDSSRSSVHCVSACQ